MAARMDVLLGAQWGDEGKGKVVDVIAPQYDSYNRLTSVTNGRSIDPYVYSYVGSTSQVSYATGSTITPIPP